MKCPKCGYLGFEKSTRCRHCGYDFSLTFDPVLTGELPLNTPADHVAAAADLALSAEGTIDSTHAPPPPVVRSASPAARLNHRESRRTTPSGSAVQRSVDSGLPLFGDDTLDLPLVAAPRAARPPLAVRRTTPEILRQRPSTPPARAAQPARSAAETPALVGAASHDEPAISTHLAPHATEAGAQSANAAPSRTTFDAPLAGGAVRLLATVVDGALLATINAAVIYLTLALLGMAPTQLSALRWWPLLVFLLLLNGGYLVLFVAASGQTIGKMLTGIRVLGDDGRRVDVASALLRAAGCGLSLATAGLGYLPAFVTADRRALQDRISGTRVVGVR